MSNPSQPRASCWQGAEPADRGALPRCACPGQASEPRHSLGFLSQTETGNFLRRNHFSQARPVHALVLCAHPHLCVPFSLKGALIVVGDTEDLATRAEPKHSPCAVLQQQASWAIVVLPRIPRRSRTRATLCISH